ncbi:hypothetical protein Vi05172_g1451 [Venturia inaequalis]|nr:hypothetical protein Vi05172_g1451 [Venturia inaequalis]
MEVPRIPARPKRSVERSVSPGRDTFARSPLNDPLHHNAKLPGSSNLSRTVSRDLPPRPPSVSLPSIGHEGDEYASLTPQPEEQAKQIAGDLPLYAPKATLPVSSAKSRIATVTRTDSSQAAAAGIGKPSSETDSQIGHTLTRSTSSQASRSRPASRPASLYKVDTHEYEQDRIPVFGIQVPMYPNAGDVQAPTPSASVPPPSTGVGYFNNGGAVSAAGRNHSRTRSGREHFTGPPDSYGLHGHGVNHKDPFEKAWYDKHPDDHAREAKGIYGPAIQEGRKDWALSSDELNKLVHGKTPANGMGTSSNVISTPDEQIGYLASEEYASRMASPRPSSAKPRRASSQTFAESPLRIGAIPPDQVSAALKDAQTKQQDEAVDSDEEDENEVIHVDPPSKRHSKIGGGGYDPPTQDLGHEGGNTADRGGEFIETGYGVPILASDEAVHRPESRFMQPAVEPELERRGDEYIDPSGRRGSAASQQNPPFAQLSRYNTEDRENISTPLDDVREYEPLFPDDDDRSAVAPAKLVAKRPDALARHQFPSQDVWEDTPESMMYQTTVDTPQDDEKSHRAAEHEPADLFESPEAEKARQTNAKGPDFKAPDDSFLSDAKSKKTGFKSGVAGQLPLRPGMTQRFPSQDIWEDSPDSQMHTTVVDDKDEEEDSDDKPVPQIPTRPSGQKVAPSIPGRPKPQVPARPSKLREISDESVEKAKPPVPARPTGSKIAALQAGFMSDLNKKLGLGPVAPKKEEVAPEPEEQKAPLADARKGRAKGPQRRKPGAAPAAAEDEKKVSKPRFAISTMTIWEVDESGELNMGGNKAEAKAEPRAAVPIPEPAPAPTETASTETTAPSTSQDMAVQTGQLDIKIGDEEGKTIFLGGRAPEPGSVVVDADGTQHVGAPDSLGGIEKTAAGL